MPSKAGTNMMMQMPRPGAWFQTSGPGFRHFCKNGFTAVLRVKHAFLRKLVKLTSLENFKMTIFDHDKFPLKNTFFTLKISAKGSLLKCPKLGPLV